MQLIDDNGAPEWAARLPNLALTRLGGEVVAASDDFFADKARLISADPPVFVPGKFDENGKWMDGWETRRRRGPGNDWCVVRLGREADVEGVDVDTTHFTGNFPHACALEAGCGETLDDVRWQPLVAQTPLSGDSHHYWVTEKVRARWLRLSIFPDGGVARLRVYGRVPAPVAADGMVDLVALENGGRVIAVSDSHFGAPINMLMPGRGVNMGDGWETRRRRVPGSDWAVLALGAPGVVRRVEVDTAHFKGNFPAAFSLNAVCVPDLHDAACVAAGMFWPPLMAQHPLSADTAHVFTTDILNDAPITHVRFNIYPDGGISRLRLFGEVAA